MIYFSRRSIHRDHTFPEHRHVDHELLWDVTGSLRVRCGPLEFAAGPNVGILIPAGVAHDAVAVAGTEFAETYFEPCDEHGLVEKRPHLVVVTAALRATLEHLAVIGDGPGRAAIETAAAHLVRPDAQPPHLDAPTVPVDDRARRVASAILASPDDRRTLTEHGRQVGASARTLTRIFVAETGVAFGHWRTNARMWSAAQRLSIGRSVSEVAHEMGYSDASTFGRAFRSATGLRPSQCRSWASTRTVVTHVLDEHGWTSAST